MAYDFGYEVRDGVGTVTFNRPETLNALTFTVYRDLEDLLWDLRRGEEVKVLVLTGQGRGFCSGGDVHEIIGELFKRDVKGMLEFTRMTGAVVRNMRLLDKPIIAAVNGTAAGAGAVIALAADFRIFSDRAKIAFLFSKVGLAGADMGAAYLLPRIVGLGRATELLMLGDTLDAQAADRYGLAYQVVPHDSLMDAARGLAGRLAAGPSLALSMTKQMLNNELNMDLASALEQEAQAQALMLMGRDHKEFYEAFTQRKKWRPEFTEGR